MSGIFRLCSSECRKPPKPDHVIILGNVFGIDSKISSICDQGYAPVTGVGETRVCQYDGTWSGTEPVCGKGTVECSLNF